MQKVQDADKINKFKSLEGMQAKTQVKKLPQEATTKRKH